MKELQEQKKIAEDANQSKSAFLSVVSHEIRTPMNAVLGMAEMALREEMSNEAREYVSQIKASGKHLPEVLSVRNQRLTRCVWKSL